MPNQIKQVLLIDDDATTNMLHTRIVKRTGCVEEVLVATDGVAALDLLDAQLKRNEPLPELILLDINMPRMDGFEFLKEYGARDLGGKGQKVVVMVSTSLLPSDHEKAAADPNVHGFSDKLIRPEELVGFVDRCCDGGQAAHM